MQFLVRALQLFVRGDELFVRRLQLLVRGLHLLDRGLEVFLGVAKLLLDVGEPIARRLVEVDGGLGQLRRRLFGLGLKRDQKILVARALNRDRLDRKLQLFVTGERAQTDTAVNHRRFFFRRALQRAGKGHLQIWVDEVQNVVRRSAVGNVEKFACAGERMDQLSPLVDHQAGRNIGL
jgi:hypothetical protein